MRSSARDDDGSFVHAYRVRWAEGPNDTNAIARSDHGEHFETVAALDESHELRTDLITAR